MEWEVKSKELLGVNATDVHKFYSRFLRLGYLGKFEKISELVPNWKLEIWSFRFGFFPAQVGNETSKYRYMLQYFIICVILFLMSFWVEHANFRRFNMQAKILNDHNPLVHRKGLQSLTDQQRDA